MRVIMQSTATSNMKFTLSNQTKFVILETREENDLGLVSSHSRLWDRF